MTILEQLNTVLAPLGIPFETGVFTDKAPDSYLVIIPMTDTFELHADNAPGGSVEEARLALYTKGSYTKMKNAVTKALLAAEMTVTERQYLGFETDTGYHHYNIDVANYYEMEE